MEDTRNSADAPRGDPLAELIRAGGRRPEPPAEHYRSVLDASREAWQSKVRSRRRARFAYALAASLLVALTAAVLVQTLPQTPRGPVARLALARGDVSIFSAATGAWQPVSEAGTAVFAGDRLRTSAEGRASFALPSGISLRIHSDTRLELTGMRSLELLAGTVYIDSGDSLRTEPVQISTAYGIVRDIGTQFEVHGDAESLRLRVRSGMVELVDSVQTADRQTPAGYELEISSGGAAREREFSATDPEWIWVQELAIVPELPDRSVLGYFSWAANELGRTLRFDSIRTRTVAESIPWRGDPAGLTPTQVLDAISATSDFTYELTSEGAILMRRK